MGDSASLGTAAAARDGLRFELGFVGAALAIIFVVFYRKWPVWEDQAIYHYMAWGLGHGLVPYRDTINMNWPGSIAVHAIARAISGADGFGLRLLDVGLLMLLSAASALLLRAYRVEAPMRVLCHTSNIAAYFTTDFAQTAQRESFALPLVAAGIAAALIQARRGDRLPRWAVFGCGTLAGLGLAVKPTLVAPLACAQAVPLLLCRSKREALRFTVWLGMGELAAAAVTALAIVGLGDVPGFIEWGLRYTFGAYATVKWPMPQRLLHTLDWTLWAPPALVALTGALAAAARPRHDREREGEPDRERQPGWAAPALFAGLALLTLGTILFQGKTHCRYQFHPFFWFLSLAGAAVVQVSVGYGKSDSAARLIPALCAAVLVTMTAEAAYRRKPYLQDGTLLGSYLKRQLAPDDEFVLFGFAPTVHSAIGRRTPFPFVDSWVVLSCAGDAAEADVERRIGDSLARSVRVPAVKCVLVQRSLSYKALGKTKMSEEIARRHIPGKALRALGYWHSVLHMPGGSAFDVWLRGTVTEPWWTKHPQKAEHPGATANADDGLDRDAETGSLAGRETSGSRR